MDFRHRAACRTVDPEVFFPLPGDEDGVAMARAVCAGCPVRSECLEFALRHGLDDGVFGGLTADERRAFRARSLVPRKVHPPVRAGRAVVRRS